MLNRANGSDGRPGKLWNTTMLKSSVLDSHIYSADIALSDVLNNICNTSTIPTTGGALVDVSQACAVLSKWDRSNTLNSVGGHIWREFWSIASAAQGFYTTPYSGSDPVNTPRAINTTSPQVKAAFAQAVQNIQNAGFAMDAPLSSIQHSGVNGIDIPIFGGLGNIEGAYTIANPRSAITKDGYPVIYGNSHVEVATWTSNGPDAKVVAEGFITYSESTDPANPHYNDFTRNYSQQLWQPLPFHDDEIAAQQISQQRLTE